MKIPTPADLGLAPGPSQFSPLSPQSINVPDLGVGAAQVSGLGRAMMSVYQNAARVQIELQKIEDERILMENESALADFRRNALYGDGGLLTRKLGDAVGISDAVPGMFQEWSAQLPTGGLSEAGQDAMREVLLREEDGVLDVVARHEMTQREAYRAAMISEAAAKAEDEARYYYAQPDRLEAMAEDIRASFRATIPDPALAEAAGDAAVARAYKAAALQAVGDEGYKYAIALLEVASDEGIIKADDGDAARIMHLAVTEDRADTVNAIASNLWAQAGGDLTAAYSMAASAQMDGETRDDVEKALDDMARRSENASQKEKADALQLAEQLALNGRLDALPAAIAIMIDDDDLARLDDMNQGFPQFSNGETHAQLLRLTDEELLKVDLIDYASDLSRKDYTTLMDRQGQARDGRNARLRGDVQSTLQNFFTINGIGNEKKQAQLTVAIEDWIAEQDKVPTSTEIRAKLGDLNASIPVSWASDPTVATAMSNIEEGLSSEQLAAWSSLPTDGRMNGIIAAGKAGKKYLSFDGVLAAMALLESGHDVSAENLDILMGD